MRACVRLGLEVTIIVSGDDKDFGGGSDGGRRLLVEEMTIESTLRVLTREGLAGEEFDSVYTTYEPYVITAAALGVLLGTRSMDPEVAVRFRDKAVAKRVLRGVGVPTAEFVVVPDIQNLPAHLTLPFQQGVLKPVAGDASYRAAVVRSVADIRQVSVRARAEQSEHRSFILEQFMSGEEWFADGVMHGGELVFLALGRYQQTCLETVSAINRWSWRCFDPHEDPEIYASARALAATAVPALGLTDGTFHLEMFHDQEAGTTVFGECAARRGGGLVEQMVERKFGVSLAEAAIRCALGADPAVRSEIRPGVVGSVALPNMTGTLLAHPSAAGARRASGGGVRDHRSSGRYPDGGSGLQHHHEAG